MAVILLKLVFLVMSTLSNLLTRLIFNAAAHVLVQMIQALKVPGEGSQRLLDQVRSMITKMLEYLSDLMIQAVSKVLSSLFDVVKEGVLSSSSGLAAAVAGLVEKSRTSLNDAVEDVPEVLEAFREMVAKIATDFWNNCNEAVTYVTQNVLN
ncbi:hypothetical protein Salat_0385600 [Sesamum alatum]|uniref:Uncharacterized protein n=1 Tax=Sesamum alatum TaxID=300844 RepID=A0AAE2CZL2_9LAMI|nr:hypothetical protein Salat_0385600 [Sesamum alatum]